VPLVFSVGTVQVSVTVPVVVVGAVPDELELPEELLDPELLEPELPDLELLEPELLAAVYFEGRKRDVQQRCSSIRAVEESPLPAAALVPLVEPLEPASLAPSPHPARTAVTTTSARIRTGFPSTALSSIYAPRVQVESLSAPAIIRVASRGVTVAKRVARCAAGNPAISSNEIDLRPEALRPRLAAGLPFTLRGQ
jgi:hypothetical protein